MNLKQLTVLKLVGGDNWSYGTVEIIKPIPGTVCDNGWDDHDAKVVCRMLNLQ